MTSDMYTVLKALPSDAEHIARFQIAMARETEGMRLAPKLVAKGVRHVFDDPATGFYLVAKDAGGNAIGCLMVLKEWSDWRNAQVWWIHSLYVLPEHRRKGIYRRMYEQVEKLARAAGVRGLRLYVDKRNVAAQHVYAKLGMTREHYEMFEKMF